MYTWSDSITIEGILLRHLLAFLDRLLSGSFDIECSPKSSGSLLVHLCSRRNAINCHEEELLGFDLSKQMLDVVENGDEHLLFTHPECRIVRILVRTIVDDAVHVKIQTIEFWYPVFCDQL